MSLSVSTERGRQILYEWNSRDIAGIIARLTDDVELMSRNPRQLPKRRTFKVVGKAAVAAHLRAANARFSDHILESIREENGNVSLNLLHEGLVRIFMRLDPDGRIASIESYRTTLGSPMLSTRIIPRS